MRPMNTQQAMVLGYINRTLSDRYELIEARVEPCGKAVQVCLLYKRPEWKSGMYYSAWRIIGPRGGKVKESWTLI